MVRLHGAEIAMFSIISNVSIFLCLVLFIREAGRYTSSSLLSERFRWREKQLCAGLSGHISKLVKDLCCLNNFVVLFRRIKTNIYGNSSKSFHAHHCSVKLGQRLDHPGHVLVPGPVSGPVLQHQQELQAEPQLVQLPMPLQ